MQLRNLIHRLLKERKMIMVIEQFNATGELTTLRNKRSLELRQKLQQTRLVKLRSELLALRNAGASFRELALWLRERKHIKLSHTAVMRYITQLPEFTGNHYAGSPE